MGSVFEWLLALLCRMPTWFPIGFSAHWDAYEVCGGVVAVGVAGGALLFGWDLVGVGAGGGPFVVVWEDHGLGWCSPHQLVG